MLSCPWSIDPPMGCKLQIAPYIWEIIKYSMSHDKTLTYRDATVGKFDGICLILSNPNCSGSTCFF